MFILLSIVSFVDIEKPKVRTEPPLENGKIASPIISPDDDHATLTKAFELAVKGNFIGAIDLADSIPSNSSKYDQAQVKIREWSQAYKQQLSQKDHATLQKAFGLANQGNFEGAIAAAKTILPSSEKYVQAQKKIGEWETLASANADTN